MDEFKDIDAELMRLKEELSLSDELTRQVKFPASGDYWKSRLDEERLLWDKKAALGTEERKIIERKLAEQDQMLQRYSQSFSELERKLQNDTKLWEERLRLKEADILIEKNRLQCESRVKEIEIERQRLLEHVTELSAKISALHDDQAAEIEKLKQHSKLDAENYEEKLRIASAETQKLQARAAQIEETLKNRVAELESLKEEYRDRLEATEGKLQEELQARFAAERETAKSNENNNVERARLLKDFNKSASKYGEGINRELGILSGLMKLVSERPVGREVFSVISDIAGKAQAQADSFEKELNIRFNPSDDFKAALVMAEDDAAYWEAALSGTKIELAKINLKKNIQKEIFAQQPCVCVVPASQPGAAKRIKSHYPFMPIVVFGQASEKQKVKLKKSGYVTLSPYSTADDMILALFEASRNSVARREYWDKIKIKRSWAKPAAVVFAALFLAAGFYYRSTPAFMERFGKVATYSVPYTQPSNIAFDGQFLWGCDWFGQSIYKHDTGNGLKLLRIFCQPGRHFTAITWAGGYLWSADAWDQKIYKHNTDDNFTVLETYPAPGTSITGLAFDGKNLWSCDSSAGMIYRHAMDENLTVEDAFESPGTSPSGLFFDGKNLWSVDSKINKLFRHKMDTTLSVEASFIPPLYDMKNYNISGLAIKNDKFWVCSEKLGKVFSFPKEKMEEIR